MALYVEGKLIAGGYPKGGETGEILRKTSKIEGAIQWVDVSNILDQGIYIPITHGKGPFRIVPAVDNKSWNVIDSKGEIVFTIGSGSGDVPDNLLELLNKKVTAPDDGAELQVQGLGPGPYEVTIDDTLPLASEISFNKTGTIFDGSNLQVVLKEISDKLTELQEQINRA